MKSFNLISALLVALFLTNCSGSGSGDDNPDGGQKVTIYSSANFYSKTGEYTAPDIGTTVKVVGTNLTAQTTSNGLWEIPNVPVGEIDLEFTRDNMGTHIINNIDLNVGRERVMVAGVLLAEKATATITSATVEQGSGVLVVKLSTSPTPSSTEKQFVTMFFGRDESVSNTKNEGYLKSNEITQQNPTINIVPQVLSQYGFSSGETLYISLYTDSWWSNTHTNQYKLVYKYDEGYNFPNVNPNSRILLSIVIP